jgi:hypothetical protein
MAVSPECMSCGCWRQPSMARITLKTSTSAPAESGRAAPQVMPTRAALLPWPHGRVSLIQWRGSFFMKPGQEHRLAAADALNPLSSAWGACKSSGLPSVGVSPRDDMDSGLRAADCEAVRAAQSARRQRQRYARLRRIISPAHRSRRRRPRRIPARVLAFGQHQTIPPPGASGAGALDRG